MAGECWALFDDDDLAIDVTETLPITPDMPALASVTIRPSGVLSMSKSRSPSDQLLPCFSA